MPPSKFLASLSHAVAGSAGSALSTLATYPLDLVNTRLKVQRQLRADGSLSPVAAYAGLLDAVSKIHAREGGAAAFFAGLGPDMAKSVADSFLFFLFYTWFRARRTRAAGEPGARPHLGALEELAVGAAAGACARLFTTPAGNVVTRRQTASLRLGGDSEREREPTFGESLAEIRAEKGVLGLWAGYSASLVLTLNPSITFFLQQTLKRTLVPREEWDTMSARTTFLLAAVSKMVATGATYPFQIAKVRVQFSAPVELEVKSREKGKRAHGQARRGASNSRRGVSTALGDTIFSVVLGIAKTEGPKALYDGIGGELLKAFFSHGLTMVSKDVVHRFIVQLYFALIAAAKNNPEARVRVVHLAKGIQSVIWRQGGLARALVSK